MIVRVATALLLSGTVSAAAGQSSQPPSQQAAPAQAPPAVTSPGNAKWAASPDEAKALAASTGKFVYLEFERPECGQCQRMDALLYPAFDFEALLINMVPVKLSLDSAEGKELGRRYGSAKLPPCSSRARKGASSSSCRGLHGTNEFYQHVRQDLAAYRAFPKRIEAQDIATLAPKEALDTGRELYAAIRSRRRACRASAAPSRHRSRPRP